MRFWPRNNENVLIVGRVLADIRDLLVYVTFNTTAQRRIKLRQIADFQCIADFRLPIADLPDAAMIATSSLASLKSGSICVFPRIPPAIVLDKQPDNSRLSRWHYA